MLPMIFLTEIRELARQLGLDPNHLVIKEPFVDANLRGRRYGFKYSVNGQTYDYNFIVSRIDIDAGVESEVVRLYVNIGLRELKAMRR